MTTEFIDHDEEVKMMQRQINTRQQAIDELRLTLIRVTAERDEKDASLHRIFQIFVDDPDFHLPMHAIGEEYLRDLGRTNETFAQYKCRYLKELGKAK